MLMQTSIPPPHPAPVRQTKEEVFKFRSVNNIVIVTVKTGRERGRRTAVIPKLCVNTVSCVLFIDLSRIHVNVPSSILRFDPIFKASVRVAAAFPTRIVTAHN